MKFKWLGVALTAGAFALAGCGDDDSTQRGGPERADRPAKAPPGWRTVRNARAGFTLAVPDDWTARTKEGATLVRSRDRLMAVTVAVDRGKRGRELELAEYARRTLEALPGFEGSLSPTTRRVRGSPYRSARVEGSGTVQTSRRPQRITVATFRPRGGPVYAVVVFRNANALRSDDERALARMLRTLRAG
jgi:hypothetical protein